MEELIQFDKELFLYLNGLGNTTWDGFWMFITGKWNSIPLYLGLAFFSFKQLGLKRTVIMLVFVALMITATDGLANFFKYGVARLRPCHDPEINSLMRLVKASCGGKFGYFSGHAVNSTAIAFFFVHLFWSKFKYLGIFLLLWMILVSYSRIYIGVHFPLDVLTGIVIGLFLSYLFVKLYIFALLKFRV
ncbi:phosphatase PAP2 family protein [Spongiimicrobium salis]|uniref:phosphatase PAP2 family protein n=1 Tax=Spongiimicrobium salis TaxID=1667022 RepID=UPI00374CC2E6